MDIEAIVKKYFDPHAVYMVEGREAMRSALTELSEAYEHRIIALNREVVEADERIRQLESERVQEWQPIETAPGFNPDGDTFLMFEPHRMGGFCFVGVRDGNGDFINNLDFKIQEPTHWMPLPAAPQPKKKEPRHD